MSSERLSEIFAVVWDGVIVCDTSGETPVPVTRMGVDEAHAAMRECGADRVEPYVPLSVANEPRWIPTSERLPREPEDLRGGLSPEVLFVHKGEVFPGWYLDHYREFIWMESGGEQLSVPEAEVTHWMLLPEPPKATPEAHD